MMLKNSYITKSYEVVDQNRMSRDQALPGFPYISYKGAQIVEMAYSFKLLLRDNVLESVYRDDRGRQKSLIDMTNKTLRDVVSKGFIKTHSLGHEYGNMYSLDELGFEYLGVKPFDTDFSRRDLARFYAVNRVFSTLCLDYRGKHTIEWETGGEVGDAASIIWENSSRKKAVKSQIWVFVQSNFRHDRVKEIQEIIDKYSSINFTELPTTPEVYAVSVDRSDYTLKVVEKGKGCVSSADVERWVDGR